MAFLWIVVLAGYAICVAQSIFALTARRKAPAWLVFAPLSIAFGAHTLWLVARGLSAGRWPLAGSQDMFAFLSWALVLAYLIAYRWYRANALKAFVFPIVFAVATIAAFCPASPGQPEGLNSPLQQILFPVHAGLILLAYASFFIAFGAGLMYIIQERQLRLKRFSTVFYRLPSLGTCDSISFKSMSIGFVLLTLGIAAGIGWSLARDGVFLHGGPDELFAVLTWVVYLVIINSRIRSGWGGRTAAVASILSFTIVVCSLVGVRYLGNLHVFG